MSESMHGTQLEIAPFLKLLRAMLEREDREILRWTADGLAFEIHDMDSLVANVLPKYFKHNKYASFQRQLNYFHFKKWTKSRANLCTFSNEDFTRDDPSRSGLITRKKSSNGRKESFDDCIDSDSLDPLQESESLDEYLRPEDLDLLASLEVQKC